MVIRGALVAAAILMASACGGTSTVADASTTTAAASTTVVTTTSPETTTTATGSAPVVLGLSSGRGDDGSLEIDAWIADLPVGKGTSIVVGVDADDSYPGTGDLLPHLEGSLTVTYGADTVDQEVTVGGEVVASSDDGTVSEWVSWSFSAGHLRVYFIGDVAPLTGTLWVQVDHDENTGRGALAGTDVGYACSVRGSSIDADVPSEVPDPGTVCIYP